MFQVGDLEIVKTVWMDRGAHRTLVRYRLEGDGEVELRLLPLVTDRGVHPERRARAELAAMNPQGRLVTPQEVADAVAWLCLPSSGALTGQAIAVAGREVM